MAKMQKSQQVEIKIIQVFDTVGYHVAHVVGGLLRKVGYDD